MTSGDDLARQAAQTIWRLWQSGKRIDDLPATFRPSSIEEGWAVQRALDQHAGPVVGWKLAGSSAAGQQHIGVDAPILGALYQGQLLSSGCTVPTPYMQAAEPEFAFRLGRSLEPRTGGYTRSEVLAAVDGLHPAIEIPDSRFHDFARVGGPQLVADACCAAWVVLGEPVRAWAPESLPARRVSLLRNGQEVSTGFGANALGDPSVALTWLVNEIGRLGGSISAGAIVMTGACAPPININPGDQIAAMFEDAEPVNVTLA